MVQKVTYASILNDFIIFVVNKYCVPMKKKILYGILAVLVVIQFVGISRNDGDVVSNDISKAFVISDEVKTILKTACNDCHSNHTEYPWYARVQPIAWWLEHHVDEGKGEINFSEFATYRPARQFHKFEEIAEVVKEGEMPLASYTWIHRNAVLTADEKTTIINWANAMRDTMSAHYPADSLVMKRRPEGAK